jgi:chromosome segregation ATPase
LSTTTTIETQLAEARRRIDRLHAAAGASPRLRRHLDALEQEEASVRVAADQTRDEVEAKLGQLKTRLDVAEHSLAAELSDDWATFAAAVEVELESWDTYLERLQTSVATKAWKARAEAEAAIGDVRMWRIAVAERLSQAHDGVGPASQEQRERVAAARDTLEENADELSAKFK